MGVNGKETSLGSFRKIRNCSIFEMRTIKPKIWKIAGGKLNGTEIPRKKFSKVWLNLAMLSACPEILEDTVPFVTGNF